MSSAAKEKPADAPAGADVVKPAALRTVPVVFAHSRQVCFWLESKPVGRRIARSRGTPLSATLPAGSLVRAAGSGQSSRPRPPPLAVVENPDAVPPPMLGTPGAPAAAASSDEDDGGDGDGDADVEVRTGLLPLHPTGLMQMPAVERDQPHKRARFAAACTPTFLFCGACKSLLCAVLTATPAPGPPERASNRRRHWILTREPGAKGRPLLSLLPD